MKKLFAALIVIGVFAVSELLAGPPSPPPPAAGTAAEIAAGTETATRVWAPKTLADEFSGATAEVVDEAISTVNSDGDTTHAHSQDDIHDFLILLDTDLDGDIDTIDATLWATKESATSNDIDPDRINGDSDDDNKLDGTLVDPPAAQTSTVNDSGDGNPATGTITPTSDLMDGGALALTCSDADGCTMTMSETGATDNARITIVNISANDATFSDSAGVQELAATCTLAQYESLTLQYKTDRWVEISRATNALEISSYTTTEVDFLPIAYANDGTSAPATAALVTSTNSAMCRAFDGASNEDVKYLWHVPPDIDTTSGIKFQVVGYVGSATAPANTEVVAFSLAGVSFGNSDIMSGAVGTAQTSSLTADATYVQYDKLTTDYSAAITITNLTAGETAHLDLIRLATTTDTYAQDFHPAGINIKYKRKHDASF